MDYVAVAVVDARGRLLMQERDEHARVDPERWAFPGGGIEAGESPAQAAHRELLEETGLSLDLTELATITSWCPACERVEDYPMFHAQADDTTDDDVTCGEGRRMVFVAPADTIDKELSSAAIHALPQILVSEPYVAAHGRTPPRRFGAVFLVDPQGRILLQERDEHARIDPDRWGLSGGHLETAEEPRAGALRELAEETGVELDPAAAVHVGDFAVYHATYDSVDTMSVYAASVDLTDDDIDCREGRRIVFVDPGVALTLPLTVAARQVVPAFLHSQIYRSMRA